MPSNFNYTQIDEIFHSRIRLAILSILLTVEKAEFSFLKEKTKATDGNLGAHLKKLEDAEYIQIEKRFIDRKPVSFYNITEKGRKSIENYLTLLEQLFGKT
ncbi:MAG: transcriptional regulator [Ignavibacteriales bacterium]|nr:transcriptional regulator [Ignavibacteriales bacterium]MCF8432702.1 transcriptional regulator [Melioribacteraceae bacterium]